jgi:hypothetical protein
MAFEHLTLVGERLAGIRNQGNILAIRGLRSTNRVPAIVAEGANTPITSCTSATFAAASPRPSATTPSSGPAPAPAWICTPVTPSSPTVPGNDFGEQVL